jgi:hypothetical protein
MKILNGTVSLYMIRNIYCSNFDSCLGYGIILWGEDKESNKISKLQKKFFQMINGDSNSTADG